MTDRRKFIRQSMLAAGSLLVSPLLAKAVGQPEAARRLTILHTNDTHSRIDPFPMDGSRNQGLGGVAARAALISRIRAEEEEVLLLDAGDIFQGTPYFNLYQGEPELKAMTAMGYEAATIGNHDFDGGIQNLADQLAAHARFPMIISNYDFSGTPMEGRSLPYKIFRKGGLKIGVTGVGIELNGLVPEAMSGKTVYLDPVQKLNEAAAELKRQHCDLVICLSHLGYKYSESENKISDQSMVKDTENVDLIIGGHTHTFLDQPYLGRNKKGEQVVINQVGFAGLQLGRLDYIFDASGKKKLQTSGPIPVTKKTRE